MTCRVLYMTTKTQRHEIEAWLGDDHGLSHDQVAALAEISDEIYARYVTVDPDAVDPEEYEADQAQASEGERDVALTTAYRVMQNDPQVVEELAASLRAARGEESRALAGLQQAAVMLVGDTDTQAGFARRAGVDRMTVRDWLGLREDRTRGPLMDHKTTQMNPNEPDGPIK